MGIHEGPQPQPPSVWIVASTYDDGEEVTYSRCDDCLHSQLDVMSRHAFEDGLIEFRITRRMACDAN